MQYSIIHILEYYILFQIILQANLSAMTIFFGYKGRNICNQWYFVQKISNYNNMKRIFKNLLLSVSSAVVGFINGFFGGGGGMLCVPTLEKIGGLPTKKSHATAIAVILPVSALSAGAYIKEGVVPTDILLVTVLGVLLGGVIGAVLLKKLPPLLVGAIFSVMMIVVGVKTAL